MADCFAADSTVNMNWFAGNGPEFVRFWSGVLGAPIALASPVPQCGCGRGPAAGSPLTP